MIPEITADNAQVVRRQTSERLRVNAGFRIHSYRADDEWEVWLNTEVVDFDGLCIGAGPTREAAMADATATLEAVLGTLRQRTTPDFARHGMRDFAAAPAPTTT